MKSLVLFAFFNIMAYMNSIAEEGKFRIYCFNRNIPGYQLSTYNYDSTWLGFLKSAGLDRASLVLSDLDIERYDWETQEITLTIAGYENLKNLKKNTPLAHLKFIVTCNEKRIYAGEFVSYGSAMAISHPVIHYDIEHFRGERKLRIYPVHSIDDLSLLSYEIRGRTATNEIKSYFKSIGKLR